MNEAIDTARAAAAANIVKPCISEPQRVRTGKVIWIRRNPLKSPDSDE